MICRELEEWAKTDVDALFIQDDWETQISLLISPELWREMFKPLYSDYIRIAKKYGKKVIAFAGSVTDDAGACNEAGIDAFFPIVRGITTLEEAMEPERARKNMELAVEQVFRLICG